MFHQKLLKTIAFDLKLLGFKHFKFVSAIHLQVLDGAIIYDEFFGYMATRNDLKFILNSYLKRYENS